MDKREAQLLNAASMIVAYLPSTLKVLDPGRDLSMMRSALDKLQAALRNYVPPITSDPGFDGRDNSSLEGEP